MHEMQQLANGGSLEQSTESPVKQQSATEAAASHRLQNAQFHNNQSSSLLTTATTNGFNQSGNTSTCSPSSSSTNTSRNSFTESPPSFQAQTATQSSYYGSQHLYNHHSAAYGLSNTHYNVQAQPDYQHSSITPNSFNQSTSPSSISSTSSINSIYAQQFYPNIQTNQEAITPLKNAQLATPFTQGAQQGEKTVAPQAYHSQLQNNPNQGLTNLNEWYMNSYQNHTGILTPPSTGNSPLISLPGQYLSAAAAAAAAHHRMQALAHCN